MKASKHSPRVMLPGTKGAKAASTASTSRATAVPVTAASPSGPAVSKVHAQGQGHKRSRSSSSRVHRYDKTGGAPVLLDATTDRATTAMIYRVLCSHSQLNASASGVNSPPRPPEQLLPPLTSSNKVDLQLYALLAIIVKEYINSWYSKITPDHTFTDEIVKLFAHCTRAVEQRLRKVDIDTLLLNDLPALIESHVRAYRIASETSAAGPNTVQFRTIYHTLNPHPAFDPVPDPTIPSSVSSQKETENVYRQLMSQGVLAVLLPTEDLENVYLRTILGDIIADLILGDVVSKKVCENYSIWEYLTKVFILIQEKLGKGQNNRINKGRGGTSTAAATGTNAELNSQRSQLEKFGLLGKPDLTDGPSNNAADAAATAGGPSGMAALLASNRAALCTLMWTTLQYLYLAFITIRFIATGLYRVYLSPNSIRGREATNTSRPVTPRDTTSLSSSTSSMLNPIDDDCNQRPPFISYHVFSMTSTILNLNRRMPWLESTGAFVQYALLEGRGHLGRTDSVLDRFCHETIQAHVFTPDLIPTMLLATRAALFPGNRRQSVPQPLPVPRHDTHSSSSSTNSTAGVPPAMSTSGSSQKGSNSTSTQGSSASKLAASPAPSSPAESYQPSEVEIKTIRRTCAAAFLEIVPQKIALALFCPYASGGDKMQALTGSSLQPSLSSNQKTGDHTVQNLSSPLSPSRADPQPAAQGLAAATPARSANDELLLQEVEESLLDLFDDSYCNKHLIFSVIESILTSLFPELSEKCVTELMSERGF